MRLIDGPLAPFGDADSLRDLIESDGSHRALYQVFLQVRDAAAYILESTTIADIARMPSGPAKKSKGPEGKTAKPRAAAREKRPDVGNKTIPMPRKEHTS
jgi:hypothetical protein